MANTYNFTINAVDVYTSQNDLEKVIYNVHWTYTGIDEQGNRGSIIGVQQLEAPDPENFAAFDMLIQNDIISWIEPLLPIDEMRGNVDTVIAEKVSPTTQVLQVPVSLDTQDPVADSATEETSTEQSTEETV